MQTRYEILNKQFRVNTTVDSILKKLEGRLTEKSKEELKKIEEKWNAKYESKFKTCAIEIVWMRFSYDLADDMEKQLKAMVKKVEQPKSA